MSSSFARCFPRGFVEGDCGRGASPEAPGRVSQGRLDWRQQPVHTRNQAGSIPAPATNFGPAAVLALDLGTKTGWAIRHVDDRIASGVTVFEARGGIGFRFLRFRAWLTEIKNAGGGLKAVYYERVDFSTTTEQSRTIFGFEATLTAWCEHHGIPYRGVAVSTLKKFATGSGRAKKPDMIAAAQALGHDVKSDDEADALMILYHGLERLRCAA